MPTVGEILKEAFKRSSVREAFTEYKKGYNIFMEKWARREWEWNKTRKDNFEDRYLE